MSSVSEQSSLHAPRVDEVRESLRRLLGDDYEAAWAAACARVPMNIDTPVLDEDQFERLLDGLAERGSLSRVIAMSWRIRRTAARKLSELGR